MPRRNANVLINWLTFVHKRFIEFSIVLRRHRNRIEAPNGRLQLLHLGRDKVGGESSAAKAKFRPRIGHFAKVMTDTQPHELPE